jgi:hypothetical protein
MPLGQNCVMSCFFVTSRPIVARYVEQRIFIIRSAKRCRRCILALM